MNLTNDYLVLQDTIQDKPIELEKETDLPNGLEVVVAIRLKPEDGLRLAAGADMTPEEIEDLEDILSGLRGGPIKISGEEPA